MGENTYTGGTLNGTAQTYHPDRLYQLHPPAPEHPGAGPQVFNLINSRYLSGRPMVITTNLTLQQMKSPQTMGQKRIFDRVLEVCIPVCFDGKSQRREKAAENFRFYRELTAGPANA